MTLEEQVDNLAKLIKEDPMSYLGKEIRMTEEELINESDRLVANDKIDEYN